MAAAVEKEKGVGLHWKNKYKAGEKRVDVDFKSLHRVEEIFSHGTPSFDGLLNFSHSHARSPSTCAAHRRVPKWHKLRRRARFCLQCLVSAAPFLFVCQVEYEARIEAGTIIYLCHLCL